MEVIDNAINDDELNIIQEIMLGKTFPWFFNNTTIDPDTVSGVNDFQFTHIFYSTVDGCGYNESNYFNILKPIIKKLECRVLIRAKANLRTVAPEKDMISGWHRDYETNNTQTAIFYVNSNNGYTIFKESKEKVESVENRLVVFPTNLEHCGVSCTDNNQRVVINFNFIGQEL